MRSLPLAGSIVGRCKWLRRLKWSWNQGGLSKTTMSVWDPVQKFEKRRDWHCSSVLKKRYVVAPLFSRGGGLRPFSGGRWRGDFVMRYLGLFLNIQERAIRIRNEVIMLINLFSINYIIMSMIAQSKTFMVHIALRLRSVWLNKILQHTVKQRFLYQSEAIYLSIYWK